MISRMKISSFFGFCNFPGSKLGSMSSVSLGKHDLDEALQNGYRFFPAIIAEKGRKRCFLWNPVPFEIFSDIKNDLRLFQLNKDQERCFCIPKQQTRIRLFFFANHGGRLSWLCTPKSTCDTHLYLGFWDATKMRVWFYYYSSATAAAPTTTTTTTTTTPNTITATYNTVSYGIADFALSWC